MEFATWSLLHGVCYMEFATWSLQHGVCNMEFATWSLQHGVCNMEFATWSLQHGVCNMEFATWSILHAVCSMIVSALNWTPMALLDVFKYNCAQYAHLGVIIPRPYVPRLRFCCTCILSLWCRRCGNALINLAPILLINDTSYLSTTHASYIT